MEFPTLQTKRLELKQLSASDNQALFDIFSNSDVVKYYDLDVFNSIKQSDELIQFFRSRFESGAGVRWGVHIKGQDKCLGTCGFNSWNRNMRSTSIGYELNKDYWGQGIITEALFTIINTIFSDNSPFGHFNRIQADTIPGNIASERVLTKLGFKQEGVRRQSGYWKNQYHDLTCFGLLKNEFRYPA